MSGKSGRSCSPAPTYFAFPANSKLDQIKSNQMFINCNATFIQMRPKMVMRQY
ncbi:unnamed protein product [Acanthoscelides obtectus]|uniref:Uncharacterized protein n=1 Tax=Acanthoscelides obtectus TaxID=200917 RepID=A0A9P0KN12_ACAOB|nr:unnamed protein product [Acanthoscelides obtectus]CAK1654721.1 hypothetical protein AOBTE_LOCUS18791 [Acanthoscelides obtectus]